jgi:hypothetical protein
MPEEVTDLRHKTAREKHTGMPARARQSAVTGHESGSTAALGVQNDARRSHRSAREKPQKKAVPQNSAVEAKLKKWQKMGFDSHRAPLANRVSI